MDGTRDLIYQEEKARSLRLAYGCRLPHKKSIVKIIKGKEAQFKLRYGFVPAQLPDMDTLLNMVVVKGYGVDIGCLLFCGCDPGSVSKVHSTGWAYP